MKLYCCEHRISQEMTNFADYIIWKISDSNLETRK